jgi:hypothetical protein
MLFLKDYDLIARLETLENLWRDKIAKNSRLNGKLNRFNKKKIRELKGVK